MANSNNIEGIPNFSNPFSDPSGQNEDGRQSSDETINQIAGAFLAAGPGGAALGHIFTNPNGNWMLLSDGDKYRENLTLYNNRATSVVFGSDGNVIVNGKKPGDTGCGGKTVLNANTIITKSDTVAIEVNGDPDAGDAEDKENVPPAYSMIVYGDIFIESVDGEVAVSGKHITVDADETLNLVGKTVNINANDGTGRVNIDASKVKVTGQFIEKNLTGGEYTTGSGEQEIVQYDPNASVNITSTGDFKHTFLGNYDLAIQGDLNGNVTGSTKWEYTGGYSEKVLRDKGSHVYGKLKQLILGSTTVAPQLPSYNLETSVPGSPMNFISYGGVSFNLPTPASKFKVATGPLGKVGDAAGGKAGLSILSLSDTNFNVNFGQGLSSIDMKPGLIEIQNTPASKLTIAPALIQLNAPAIKLN
jgi:hypothetical protein